MEFNICLIDILGLIMVLWRRVIDEKNMTALLVENMYDMFSNLGVFYPQFSVNLRLHLCGSF